WLEQLEGGGWVTTCEDITERRRSEKRIAHMARHDALTGLPNRLLFRDRMDEAVARLGRGEAFALLYLDLDNFKTVNDALGHAVGDQLLRAVTDRLQACLREVDTVARLGGDEFAVILPGTANADAARQIARRLINVVGDRLEIGGHAIAVGVSIGVALAPGDGATADTLLMHADLALYRAKAEGRGVVCFYEPELSTRIEARRTLEADLLQALTRDEFELYYQPIVNLDSMTVVGFEALIRWNHPRHGLVPPNHFIPLAEETGLILRLGAWVLQAACAQAAGWPEPVKVAVNLSPVQFRDAGLVPCIKQALDESGLPPERLELEITEAAILRESEATLAALSEIRMLGVRIAFDDFGTGFSSLSYLHRFAFDKIKIDQSFVRDLCSSPSAAAIVRAIAGLGGSLRLVTTAEGVETAEQMRALRLVGCTEAQGYLFSKPRPNSEVPRLLNEDRRLGIAAPGPATRRLAG
ncbi:MAG: EAL domain-containing protein, partial [Pseudomonadota bacterium]|nr:EAL domain-containing protein [Pseudomonadota bacterium]